MSDRTGIENVGEFFSQHYLDELLVGDLKDLRKTWRDAGSQAPPTRLASISAKLTRAMGEAARHSRPERLYELSHPLQVAVCEALGYGYQPGVFALGQGRGLPYLSSVDQQGEPYLLVVEGRFVHESEAAALELHLPDSDDASDDNQDNDEQNEKASYKRPTEPLSQLFVEAFAQSRPPRWIVLLAGSEVVLAERARFGRGQYLRFDLAELLGRRDATALAMTASLLCKECLVPESGTLLHDTLDENSHKHAHGVSSELKYAARKAVEFIGNEYVWYQRNVRKRAMYGDEAAADLTAECLTYLYRLLFLFYAEARAGELRSLPMDAEEYRLGYSLEALRDLEMVPLSTPESQNGYFIHESLQTLFRLVDQGHHGSQTELLLPNIEADTGAGSGYLDRGFQLSGLHSPLFNPANTPLLSAVRFRNTVLQEVIGLLSLSGEGRRGKSKKSAYGRGRISYAQLGINQLGSVYEGLLSYSGFFSREKLYEVHKAGEEPSETDQAFFVPASQIDRYTEEEYTFAGPDGERVLKTHEQGTFIFRLAGRNRETSASYYTPEVLTQCLVKYSLKELLEGKSADDILGLTVCEPALGSGAFVVEAIDQLADAYLQRKEAELGEKIPPDEYGLEKQRVKAAIATRNCYGVDLNPMAARLAEVSLWLATMHQGQSAPWFGARLGAGNSLVGARLAVWDASDLQTDDAFAKSLSKVLKSHAGQSDLREAVDALVAGAESGAVDACCAVREVLAESDKAALIAAESGDAEAGSGADGGDDAGANVEGDAETLAQAAAAELQVQLVKNLKKAAKDFRLPRYQRKPPAELSLKAILAGEHAGSSIYHFLLPDPGMSPFDKDKAVKELVPDAVKTLGAWRKGLSKSFAKSDGPRLVRLSRRIDALLGHLLEDRRDALALSQDSAQIWGQGVGHEAGDGGGEQGAARELPIDKRIAAHGLAKSEGRAYRRLRSVMDLWAAQWAWPLEHASRLPTREAWWGQVEAHLGVESEKLPSLSEQLELVPLFDELAANRGAQAKAGEPGASSDADVVADAVARLAPFHWWLEFPEVSADRGGFDLVVGNPPWIKLQWNEQGILGDIDPRVVLDGASASEVAKQRKSILGERLPEYLVDFEGLEGSKAFLNVEANYPLLKGVQTNLYKCFIEHSWRLGSNGVVGMIHQDGVFDDPRGGALRSALFERLRGAYRFKNELVLFAEVHHLRPYCLSISLTESSTVEFALGANLFHPKTIDESWGHDGAGQVPGIKNDDNQFETRGHKSRLVKIGLAELEMFASLFDPVGTDAARARLPIVHSQEVLSVLAKLAQHPRRLSDLGDDVYGTEMWHETNAQKDGTIQRETRMPSDVSEWIVSGPHFYVGNPFNKSPRENCRHNQDYDVTDLESISDDYLPRTNYVPACSPEEYKKRTPKFKGKPITEYYRHVHRRMLAITGERSIVPSLIPPGVGHIHTVVSVCFASLDDLIFANGLWTALLTDFLVRSKGGSDLTVGASKALPVPLRDSRPGAAIGWRVMRLSSLTPSYSELWNEASFERTEWSLEDVRLSHWPVPQSPWSRHSALRNPFERRQALVEIDGLAALELKITADELCTIYRTQFPVLRDYENNTYYDTKGRIAFTNNRGLAGVGLARKDFEAWQAALAAGDPTPEGFETLGLVPPFDRSDREEDMRRAYYFFADKLGIDIPERQGKA